MFATAAMQRSANYSSRYFEPCLSRATPLASPRVPMQDDHGNGTPNASHFESLEGIIKPLLGNNSRRLYNPSGDSVEDGVVNAYAGGKFAMLAVLVVGLAAVVVAAFCKILIQPSPWSTPLTTSP